MQLTLNVVSVALDKGYIYIYIKKIHAAITLDYYSAYSYKIGMFNGIQMVNGKKWLPSSNLPMLFVCIF